jgi:aspartyl-tRNA synthetase
MADESQEPKKLSKTELNKLKKKAAKEAKKSAAAQASGSSGQGSGEIDMAALAHVCGVRPPVEKKPENGAARVYTRVEDLVDSLDGQKVWIRGRVHRSRKSSAKMCFVVVRQRWATVQTIVEESESVPRDMVKWVAKVRSEAIVDMYGTVAKVDQPTATSQSSVELKVEKCYLVANALESLPLRVQDASVPLPLLEEQRKELAAIEEKLKDAKKRHGEEKDEEKKKLIQKEIDELDTAKGVATKYPDVDQSTRLDNRVIDLRTTANQAIFTIQSGVVNLFRDFLNSQGFSEIHSPKLISAASEGGAEVFEVKYFNTKAYLAQSPQFYKQMAISADFERVYEIGPVFRAELSDGPRHMTEFTGLDMEMAINEHYHEVLDVLGDLFVHIFKGIESRYPRELEAVRQQYPFRPFKYLEKTLRLEWPEAIAMLRQAGVTIGDLEDMNAEKERTLGRAVYEKYHTDFYIVDQFPTHIRPFYSMVNPDNPTYANAYDLFIRGEEVCSGAQRVHDPELLTQRAQEKGVDPATVQDYINAFRYGAPPHGGGGVGLDRVVMLYLGLNNIRKSAMFPRDPYRLSP